MFLPPDIHGDAVDRIGPLAGWRQKTIANGVQAAQLGARAKYILAIFKCQWAGTETDFELGIK
jgi:hypothetical protein